MKNGENQWCRILSLIVGVIFSFRWKIRAPFNLSPPNDKPIIIIPVTISVPPFFLPDFILFYFFIWKHHIRMSIKWSIMFDRFRSSPKWLIFFSILINHVWSRSINFLCYDRWSKIIWSWRPKILNFRSSTPNYFWSSIIA